MKRNEIMLGDKKVIIDWTNQDRDWLKCSLKELNISHKEMGEMIGKSAKTISRYIDKEDGSSPDMETIMQIYDIINQKRSYNNYFHKSQYEFGSLLSCLMKELCLTQEQVAEITGQSQSTISNLIYHCDKGDISGCDLSTKDQYNILISLYQKFRGKHGDTLGIESFEYPFLPIILHGLKEENNSFITYEGRGYYFWRPLYCQFEKLDYEMQELVLDYPHAFFTDTIESKKKYHLFQELFAVYNNYQSLATKRREEFISDLPKTEPVYDLKLNSADEHFFYQIFEMGILSLGISRRQNNKESEKNRKANCLEFSKLMNDWGLGQEAEIELQTKIQFTKEDWYIWRLLLIDLHNLRQELQEVDFNTELSSF